MELKVFNATINTVVDTVKENSLDETEFCLLYKGIEFFLFTDNEKIYELFKLNHQALKIEFDSVYIDKLKMVSFEYSIIGNPGLLPF